MNTSATNITPQVFLSSPPDGSADPLLEPGTRLERFELVRHLGSGRTAHVYLARDTGRGHEVALKVADLRPDKAGTISLRMQQEIDIRHRLGSHPNVLTLFDRHRIRVGGLDLMVLSMEYADGGDFRQFLGRTHTEPATPLATLFMHVLNAAGGLAALHRAGLAHLDFKPENLLCVRGVWKLADFDHAGPLEELAGRGGSDKGPDEAVGCCGTPAYCSPEAAGPASGPMDSRADIFSLGVVLREVASLSRLTRPLGGRSRDPHKRNRMSAILKRCLKSDPNARFQLVEHVIEALESALGCQSKDGKPGVWPRQDRQWRMVCRCLNEGRVRDARRLCQMLLNHSPHHPGAVAVMREVEHEGQHRLETIRRLVECAGPVALSEALCAARELHELAPDHELTARLVQHIEQQIGLCQDKLMCALSSLASAQTRGFAAAMDDSAAQDPDNAVVADACMRARDLVDQLSRSTQRVDQAVSGRRFRRALALARRHRRCLARLRRRASGLLAVLQPDGSRHPTDGDDHDL
jgi:hypothetical protein